MLLDLRTYRPDSHVNTLGYAFDYVADRTSRNVAADLLEDAQAILDEAENRPLPPSSENAGMYPLTMRAAACNLARANVLLLTGALAQAEAALATYPDEVVKYAEQRFDF